MCPEKLLELVFICLHYIKDICIKNEIKSYFYNIIRNGYTINIQIL